MTGMVARIEAVIAPPARQLVTHGHVSSQTKIISGGRALSWERHAGKITNYHGRTESAK
jgi:hypothetical protein